MSTRQKRDYYEVLGVQKDADEKQLKTAFRRLARKHHPDLHPEDTTAEAKFKQVNEAYAVLSDTRLRSQYDRYGFAGISNDISWQGFGAVVETLDDLFGDIGEFWRSRRQKNRGKDARYTLEILFSEAALGCEKSISVSLGAANKVYSVTVPSGVLSGAVTTLTMCGYPGEGGGRAGDLHVVIRVKDHPLWERRKHDIWCRMPITMVQASLGATVEVPGLQETVVLTIPKGIQTGRVLRQSHKGVRSQTTGKRGDMIVEVVVETPRDVSEQQKEVLRSLDWKTSQQFPRSTAFVVAARSAKARE